MPFKDYNNYAEPPLELPINGKTYRIKPLGAKDGIDIRLAMHVPPPPAEGDEPEEHVPLTNEQFLRRVLGDTYDEMIADNVPHPSLNRAGLTAWADHDEGRVVAEIMWETGSNPELLAAYTAAKTQELTTSKPSPDTESATETPQPDSSKTTTSPTTTRSSRGRQGKADRSPGPT